MTAANARTPLRVGLVVDRFDPARGGVEQWTWQFARMLLARGHEVHALARDFAPGIAAAGCQTHAIAAGRSRLVFAAAIDRELQRLSLDVVHDTGAGWTANVFQPHGGSRRASFERNLALMPVWQRPLKRAAARLLPRYREFDALARRQYTSDGRIVLALSRMVAGDLQRYDGVRPQQIRIVYNGVDTERFSPAHRAAHRDATRAQLAVAPDEILLLIVAHNFRLKGVPTLLRAVGQLRAAGFPIRLVVAGGRPGRHWSQMARRAGAADATIFSGSTDDPIPLYAAADVYVQPTFYDPCSLVVLEALASGLPVVTSRFNGAGELMTPGREGYLVADPADADELMAALLPLVDRERREMFGRAARALALRHTLDHNVDEILSAYSEARSTYRSAA